MTYMKRRNDTKKETPSTRKNILTYILPGDLRSIETAVERYKIPLHHDCGNGLSIVVRP